MFPQIACCGYPFPQAGYDADPPMYLRPEFVQWPWPRAKPEGYILVSSPVPFLRPGGLVDKHLIIMIIV